MDKCSLNKDSDWSPLLQPAFNTDSFKELQLFIKEESSTKEIYPSEELIYNAFNTTSFEDVKVVIIGQDPYHGEGQAQGLSFSVPSDAKIPPSLRNIYKELNSDLGIPIPKNGNLVAWAQQGVLLLNATLTVRSHEAGSHQKKGWEEFTDEVINVLVREKKDLVFILWGKYAQKKGAHIPSHKHCIIRSAHPSPFAARHGFFGSKPFSKANNYLRSKGILTINWSLS